LAEWQQADRIACQRDFSYSTQEDQFGTNNANALFPELLRHGVGASPLLPALDTKVPAAPQPGVERFGGYGLLMTDEWWTDGKRSIV